MCEIAHSYDSASTMDFPSPKVVGVTDELPPHRFTMRARAHPQAAVLERSVIQCEPQAYNEHTADEHKACRSKDGADDSA